MLSGVLSGVKLDMLVSVNYPRALLQAFWIPCPVHHTHCIPDTTV
jgi:hypothetical protein